MTASHPPFPNAPDPGQDLFEVLDNGVRVLVRPEPDHPAVAMGVWVEHGSRFEGPEESGLAHLLEHMVFKGSAEYGVRDIAELMDRFGHEVEAWTGREMTAYSLEVLREDAPSALHLLGEMVARPRLPAEELERERQVVAAEAAMVREDPEGWLLDELVGTAWAGHPAGRPILGDPAVIGSATPETLADYHARHYRGGRILVAVAGDVDPRAVVDQCAREFGDLPSGGTPVDTVPEFTHGQGLRRGHAEQAHLALCAPGPARPDPERFAAGVANHVLGGSVTSRLFRQLREERGLAYTVYSDLDTYRDCGLWAVYLAFPPSQAESVQGLVAGVLEEAAAHGFAPEEVERARHSLRAGLLRSGEQLEQRLHQVVGDLLYHGRHLPLEERLEQLSGVDEAAVQRVLAAAWHRRQELLLLPGDG